MLKTSYSKLAMAAALTFFSIGYMPSAAAATVFCTNCATESTAQSIAQAIRDARVAITSAIRGNAQAISDSTSETGKIVADANTKTAAEIEKAKIGISAVPLDPCGVTSAAKGGSVVAEKRPGGGGRGGSSSPPTAGATSEMQKVLKIGNGIVPAPEPRVTAALAAKGACGTFAQNGQRAQSCQDAGFSASATSGFPDADIKAETIFDGPQTAAEKSAGVTRKLTIKSGDSRERTAVEAFIRNMETPVDLRTLEKNEIDSEAGRNYMALRDSYDANLSMATKPLRDQQSLITANPATIPILKQLQKSEDAGYVAARLNTTFPSWRTEGISFAELMRLEADRRYLNEAWHVRMAAADEKQLVAEQVQMQAFQGWLDVSKLERMQQQAILLGAVAGAGMRAEKMPQLVAAHKAAKR